MDTSQVCSKNANVDNTTLSSKIDPRYFSPNKLIFNNDQEMSDKEKYWQSIAPSEQHPFYILGDYLRSGTESIMQGIYSAKEYISSFSIFKEITVDDILSISSSEYMKQYCDYNETFKKQAQEKLESLIIENQPGDEKSLQHIQILLEAGIRTNHTLYSTTIKKRNIQLVALLHTHDINIDQKDYNKILKSLSCCTPEDELEYQCNDISNFIKKITQTTTSSEEYEKIEKQIKENYQSLLFELEEAIHLAEKSNKPLLILIGEDHLGLSGSFINELILLDIISQKRFVNTVHTEDALALFKLTYFGSYNWGFQDSIEQRILQLGMKKKFIDLFRFNETEMAEYKEACKNFNLSACFAMKSKFKSLGTNDTVQNMDNRNQAMAQTILESSECHAVAIVGAHHIKGLIEDTNLRDHYYIAVINTSPSDWIFPENKNNYDYLDLAEVFLQNEEIISTREVTAMNENSGVFIAPEALMEKTKAIHYDFNRGVQQSQSEIKTLKQCQSSKLSLKRNGC